MTIFRNNNNKIVSSLWRLLVVSCLLLTGVRGQQQQDGGGYYYDDPYGNDNTNYYGSGDGGGLANNDDPNSGGNDNLYHDYAARQYSKENSAVGDSLVGTIGKIAFGGVVGWVVGSKYHTSKLQKKLFEKHKKDQKLLYQQYYNDVYTLQKQNSELIDALEQYIAVTGGGKTGSTSTKAGTKATTSSSSTGARRTV